MTEVKRVMMLSVDKREESILFKPQEEFSSYPQTYANLHERVNHYLPDRVSRISI